ncbi:MAG: hypothetical protein QFB87_04925 [Patescibacteria group bacterium]|nr:hypothetical protein [Patescibacteria group bacterium]
MNRPESLALPQLYDVIAGVGNNEMKGLVFAAMRGGEQFTPTPLYRAIMELQGSEPAWSTSVTGPFSYCAAFAIAGAAEKTSDEPVAYSMNSFGQKQALPLLGHLLQVSLEVPQSLSDFHGPTATLSETGIRPCQRRLEVMRLLRDTDGELTNMTTISSLLKVKISHAAQVIQDMAATNLVEHLSTGRGKPTISFTAEPGFADMKLRSDSRPLMVDVVDFLKKYFATSNEPITNADIADGLLTDYGYSADKTALIKQISNKTTQFAKKPNALKSSRDIASSNAREAVRASEQQLQTIDSLLSVVDGARKASKAYRHEGREKLEYIVSDFDFVKTLVLKARSNSAGLKARPEAITSHQQLFATLVAAATEPISSGELRRSALARGINLDTATIRKYLLESIAAGKIAATATTQGTKYSVAR